VFPSHQDSLEVFLDEIQPSRLTLKAVEHPVRLDSFPKGVWFFFNEQRKDLPNIIS